MNEKDYKLQIIEDRLEPEGYDLVLVNKPEIRKYIRAKIKGIKPGIIEMIKRPRCWLKGHIIHLYQADNKGRIKLDFECYRGCGKDIGLSVQIAMAKTELRVDTKDE